MGPARDIRRAVERRPVSARRGVPALRQFHVGGAPRSADRLRRRDADAPGRMVGAVVCDRRVSQDSTFADKARQRSEEHTSELQSLMRISYAVFCLKKKIKKKTSNYKDHKNKQ